MRLIKTTTLNGVAVTIKMLTMLAINKMLAIYVGPTGYAAVGQLQNAVQMLTIFSGSAINTGVTKYTAEYYSDENAQKNIWQTAGSISFFSAILVSFLIAIFSKDLAILFLHDESLSTVFLWFSGGLTFFIFNSLLLAILNGKKEIAHYVTANIFGNFLALVITLILTWYFGLYGALVSLVLYQSLAFFSTLLVCYRTKWFKFSYLIGPIDHGFAKKLFYFALMALASAIALPLSNMLIRDFIVTESSLRDAGLWEALMRVSFAYLTFVSTLFGVYFVPRFSELKEKQEVRNEVKKSLFMVLVFAGSTLPILYFLRDDVIRLLFTAEFHQIGELIGVQLIGDFFKAIAFVFAYFMIAKANIKFFIVGEVLFSLVFVLTVQLFFPVLKLEAVVYAYLLTYLLYLTFMYAGYRNFFKKLV